MNAYWLLVYSLQGFLRDQNRSTGTHLTFLTEGLESFIFRSYFDDWPQKVEPKLYEEGRGKVAGLVSFANLQKSSIFCSCIIYNVQFIFCSNIQATGLWCERTSWRRLRAFSKLQRHTKSSFSKKIVLLSLSYGCQLKWSYRLCWRSLNISGLEGKWWWVVPSSSHRADKTLQWGLLYSAVYICWKW